MVRIWTGRLRESISLLQERGQAAELGAEFTGKLVEHGTFHRKRGTNEGLKKEQMSRRNRIQLSIQKTCSFSLSIRSD